MSNPTTRILIHSLNSKPFGVIALREHDADGLWLSFEETDLEEFGTVAIDGFTMARHDALALADAIRAFYGDANGGDAS
jgi:hypothetical protein